VSRVAEERERRLDDVADVVRDGQQQPYVRVRE
jgi:hypothetical protein